jgi:hypothetical protein
MRRDAELKRDRTDLISGATVETLHARSVVAAHLNARECSAGQESLQTVSR